MSTRNLKSLGLSFLLAACGPTTINPPVVPETVSPPKLPSVLRPAPQVPQEFRLPEAIPRTNAQHESMLRGLGFVTDLGPRLDAFGQALAPGYQPLGKRYTVFQPRSELYVGGMLAEGVGEHLFEDGLAGYERRPFATSEPHAWVNAPLKNGIAGDFDGDGLQELFIAWVEPIGTTLRFAVVETSGRIVREGELDAAPDVHPQEDEWWQPALAAGDLDADGRDEVAVGLRRLYLIQNLDQSPAVSTPALEGAHSGHVFVAMGNTDWDAADELVVTYQVHDGLDVRAQYAVYEGLSGAPVQLGALKLVTPAGDEFAAREAVVAIGDVDGDRLGEIVFGGVDDPRVWSLFILEATHPQDATRYAFRSMFWPGRFSWNGQSSPRALQLLDWDGDGRKEIFFDLALLQVTTAPEPTLLYNLIEHTSYRTAAADFDGDGREELALFNAWQGRLVVFGLDRLGQPTWKHSWLGTGTPWTSLILAPANVDRDSPTLRYDGEHELLFTPPQLLAVMAAPPALLNHRQSLSAATTTLGAGAAPEAALSVTTAFSTSAASRFGYFGREDFQAAAARALDVNGHASALITQLHAATSSPGDDQVVVSTVPFDVYSYVVVASPEASDVGRRVSVNIPRSPQTLSLPRAFYDPRNGGGLDVRGGVFHHVPGFVWSYPTLAEAEHLLIAAEDREPGYNRLASPPVEVSEGVGVERLAVKAGWSPELSFSASFDFATPREGVFAPGTSVGFRHGYRSSLATGPAARFEGTVARVPARSDLPEHRFVTGLFVYPARVDGQTFLVMNYWTEPAEPE